jgi:beta-galactosidase
MEHDMLRNMKGGKPFLVMESTPGNLNWKEHYRLKRPGVHQLEMLLAAGHGADGTLYFQWRKGRGGLEKFHGAVVDHVGHENTRNFREVANIGEIYKKLDGVIGTTIKADTAVIRDWDSIWALEVSGGPTGHGKKNIETIQSHYRALYNLNVPMDVIESTCDFSQYKLVIVPMLYMLKPEVAKRLKEFVANGGVVVSTYLSGYVNESNLCFTDGWPGDGLKEVFGIWNEELDGFAPTDTQTIRVVEKNELQLYGEFAAIEFAERIHLNQAKSLAVYCHDFYANEPAVTVNDFGKGKAYYIAVRSDEDFLYAFYEKLVKSEKITTSLPLGNPIGVHASVRTDGEKEFMFLYNFNKNKMQVDFGTATYFDLLENKKKSGIQMLSGHYSTVLEIC